MVQFDARRDGEEIPVVKDYEGFGELVTGSSDPTRVILTALCMLNDPKVNSYLLDCKLKMSDRITKTQIFPRAGMPLSDGSVFVPPVENPASAPEEEV